MVKSNYKQRSGILKFGQITYKNVKIDDLKHGSTIGEGGFGHVTKCVFNHNIMAVKTLARTISCDHEEKLCMDLEILQQTKSPNIVTFYGYIVTLDKIYVCMEIMAMCLDKLYKCYIKPEIQKIPECILGKITVYVVGALNYLKKEHKIIHRDIKPSNILIDWDGTIKICDFGVSGMLVNSCANTPTGRTDAYCSPERIGSLQYDERSDIWSLGITIYELAMCEHPYENLFQMLLEITIRFSPSPKLPETYSPEFRDFIDKCLEKDALFRPKYKDIIVSLFLI